MSNINHITNNELVSSYIRENPLNLKGSDLSYAFTILIVFLEHYCPDGLKKVQHNHVKEWSSDILKIGANTFSQRKNIKILFDFFSFSSWYGESVVYYKSER
ncbi:hypothetical protein ACPUYX_11365 [Desulfosporosinus sp. SYSU MS00001]|uniref:hypothetical protein n=1 Tax=Desulfosporosinus sp. SYSU MS00001 TaxID=3416284 RepID=UPI003CFB2679